MENGRKVEGTVYCSSKFQYKDNKFTANYQNVPHVLRQLWSDDITCGFGIRSIKTGSTVFFELDTVSMDDDNMKVYKFIASPFSTKHNPILNDISAEITFVGEV